MITDPFNMTATLSELLKMEEVPLDQKIQIAEMLDSVTTDFRNRLEDGSEQPTKLVRRIQLFADASIADGRRTNRQAQDITCQEGCAHCCKQIVSCAPAEAALLLDIANKQGLALDVEKLKRQSGRNDASWLQQPIEDQVCVFLGQDNRCQVYDHRPMSCRKYFSISEPELCNIEKHPKHKTAVWFDLRAEVFTSAMFTAAGCGFLPDLLLAEIGGHREAVAHE